MTLPHIKWRGLDALIPFDIALRLGTLIPLQVLQDAGRSSDGEVVVFILTKG